MTAHLLVVEDSPTQRAQLAADLGAADYDITEAADGDAAWQMLQTRGADFDLVVSDIVMPGVDGFELCRRVKDDPELSDTPVVLLTSLRDPLEIVRGLEAGADNFLTKPYDATHLVSRVQTILANRALADTGRMELGVELTFMGRRFTITTARRQILDLLVSAFEDLVRTNTALRDRESELADAQQRLAAQLRDVEHERARLSAVLEAMPDGVVIVDPEGRATDVNPAARELFALDADDLPDDVDVVEYCQARGFALLDVSGREIAPDDWPILRAVRNGEATAAGPEYTVRLPDGRGIPASITAAPMREADGRVGSAVSVFRDVSAAAFHDRLTGLPNRTLFVDRLAWALDHRGEGDRIGVLVLAIDRFTVVHDSLGRGAGDELVGIVARRLSSALRASATVARLGGEHFGVLLDDLDDVTGAARIATRLAGVLQRPLVVGREEVFLTTSTGIATSATAGDADELIHQASTAMHRATEQGGDRVEMYDEQLGETARQRLRMEADLRRAVERDELVVHYQPVASLHDGRVVEVEALMRWQHPERGLVPPGEFIPLAEETGVIIAAGGWVLSRACEQAQTWQATAPGLRVAVNLSARQFEDPDLVDEVSAALNASGLDPAALTLEVTETALIREPQHATTVLTALRRLGVRIAIDDFGTGYSSLSYLRSLPFDVLKIDRSFIGQVGDDDADSAIVRTIIDLAHTLDFEVVAEGVETAAQLEWLRATGCDLAAGFHLARPQPPDDVTPKLSDPLIPQNAAADETTPDTTRRVLIVDDSPLMREVLRHALHTAGPHDIDEAGSGEDALAQAREHGYDLILVDYRMPGMNGVETAARLRELLPDAHIILQTATSDAELERLTLPPDIDVLTKGAPLHTVLDTLRGHD